MNAHLDDLARLVRVYGLTLAYGSDGARLAFRYPALPAHIKQVIRNHRRGLAARMAAGDIALCPSPGLHRREWYYAGRGRYVCAHCQRLDAAQLGLWKQAV